jgi:hypothetical protein
VAEEFVPAVEATGIGAEEPSHAGDEIGLRRLDHQMKMIGHETIRMDLPRSLVAGLAEREQKTLAVEVILENGFAVIAAVHEVIEGTGIFDA